MESMDLDMGEIFDEAEEDFAQIAPLPDLPDHTEGTRNFEDGDAENNEVLAQLKDLSKGAAKRVVRRPVPKLDPDRLTGARGIPILPKVFENVKFKGKGHEAEDLKMVMRRLEHWTHRLFPSMPFDQVLEKIEKLGSKKQVQTCVKKMRLDMPLLDDDFVGLTTDENRDGDVEQSAEVLPDIDTDEDMGDDIFATRTVEDQNSTPKNISPTPAANMSHPSLDTPGSSQSHGTPMQYPTHGTPANVATFSIPNGLTPEQKERMEHNKRLAMEKRAARLGIKSPGSPLISKPSLNIQASSSNVTQVSKAACPSSQSSVQCSSSRADSDDAVGNLCSSPQPASSAPVENSQPASRPASSAPVENSQPASSAPVENTQPASRPASSAPVQNSQPASRPASSAPVENTQPASRPEYTADMNDIPIEHQSQDVNGIVANDLIEMNEIIQNQNDQPRNSFENQKKLGEMQSENTTTTVESPRSSTPPEFSDVMGNTHSPSQPESVDMSEIIPVAGHSQNVNGIVSKDFEEMSEIIPIQNDQPRKPLENPEEHGVVDFSSTVLESTNLNTVTGYNSLIKDNETESVLNKKVGLTYDGIQFPGETECSIVDKVGSGDAMDTEYLCSQQSEIIPNVADDNSSVKLDKCVVIANGSVDVEETLGEMEDQQTEEELVLFLDDQ